MVALQTWYKAGRGSGISTRDLQVVRLQYLDGSDKEQVA
jgi:hypothetical protein